MSSNTFHQTRLYAVKVLDSTGSGEYSGVIAGIEYVANDHSTRNCTKGAVANMSLGGGKSQAVNDAVSRRSLGNNVLEGRLKYCIRPKAQS